MILAEHELSAYSGDKFNSHLNLEQINKVSPPKACALLLWVRASPPARRRFFQRL